VRNTWAGWLIPIGWHSQGRECQLRQRLAGLTDGRRSGRPPRFRAVQRARVTAIAYELPATRGMPLSRWSIFELACEAIEAGIVVDISPATVARWLATDAIKPWQYRSWIAPGAPDLASKAAVVLDLYARVRDGTPRTNTTAVERRLTGPLGMCTAGGCSAAASPPPGSPRSAGWLSRS
jgi:Homeodomain-like domain